MDTDEATRGDTELGAIHVVLPMRTVSGGKARLGEALDAEEREELILGLLLHTLAVLAAWPSCSRVHVVSPDPLFEAVTQASATGISLHRQPGLPLTGEGLNEGIRIGIAAALTADASSLLVLPGDLPLLSVDALDELLAAADAAMAASSGGPVVALAPSDARGGTNAMMLRPPDVISPAFGSDSFEAHLRAAEAAGAAVQVVSGTALGFDLDTPEDLERLEPARLRELMSLGREAAERVGA